MTSPQSNAAPLRRWQWNSAEDAAFDDEYHEYPEGYEKRPLSALCITLYLRGFRRFMDYSTGLVGVKRVVTYQQWMELLEERRPRGSTKPFYQPSKDELRWMVGELVRVGLIQKLPTKNRTDNMVFRMLLATKDVVHLNEEPHQNPIGATPLRKPELAVVSGSMNPKGTPEEEHHTSEVPNTTKDLSNDKSSSTDSCPHVEILALWDEVMPGNVRRPKPDMWKSGRQGHRALRARWRDGFKTKNDKGQLRYTDRAGGLIWWKSFFKYLSRSHFLMNECRPFELDWVLKAENFRKAVEGNWHDK